MPDAEDDVDDEMLDDIDEEDIVEDEELATLRGAQTLPRDAALLKVSA
jgi:hypothetical protein